MKLKYEMHNNNTHQLEDFCYEISIGEFYQAIEDILTTKYEKGIHYMDYAQGTFIAGVEMLLDNMDMDVIEENIDNLFDKQFYDKILEKFEKSAKIEWDKKQMEENYEKI